MEEQMHDQDQGETPVRDGSRKVLKRTALQNYESTIAQEALAPGGREEFLRENDTWKAVKSMPH
jgi:hypothetical protein